jgi:hypothetical protein
MSVHPILRGLSYLLALALGMLAGFFVVFNAVFTDGGALGERLMTYGIVIVVYGLLGFFFSLASPVRMKLWIGLLSGPAILILILYTLKEHQAFLLHLSYFLLAPAMTWAGAMLGSGLKNKKTSTPKP